MVVATIGGHVEKCNKVKAWPGTGLRSTGDSAKLIWSSESRSSRWMSGFQSCDRWGWKRSFSRKRWRHGYHIPTKSQPVIRHSLVEMTSYAQPIYIPGEQRLLGCGYSNPPQRLFRGSALCSVLTKPYMWAHIKNIVWCFRWALFDIADSPSLERQHEATDRPVLLSAVRRRRLRRWFGVRVHKLCLARWGLESPPLLECGLGRKDGAFCRASPDHRLGRVRDFDRTGQNERRRYRYRLGQRGQDVLFGESNKMSADWAAWNGLSMIL